MISYDVLRHGHAPRIPGIFRGWKPDSFHRSLTAIGVDQALLLGKQYHRERKKVLLGIHSPAPRALHTLALATATFNINLVRTDKLFTPKGKDNALLNKAFRKLGNDLDQYVQEPKLFKALVRFGERAAEEIVEIKETLVKEKNGVIVVANHAVTGNFVAWALAGKSEDVREICLSTQLDYADRLRVTGKKVQHIPYVSY